MPAGDGAKCAQVRSHVCPRCSKAFIRAEHLRRHVLAHDQKKLHTCTLCGSKYGRADVLQRHRRKCPQKDRQLTNAEKSRNASPAVVPGDSLETNRRGADGSSGTLISTQVHPVSSDRPGPGLSLPGDVVDINSPPRTHSIATSKVLGEYRLMSGGLSTGVMNVSEHGCDIPSRKSCQELWHVARDSSEALQSDATKSNHVSSNPRQDLVAAASMPQPPAAMEPAAMLSEDEVPTDSGHHLALQGESSATSNKHVELPLSSTSTSRPATNVMQVDPTDVPNYISSFPLSDDFLLEDALFCHSPYNSSGLTIPSTPTGMSMPVSDYQDCNNTISQPHTVEPSTEVEVRSTPKYTFQIGPDELELFHAKLADADANDDLERFQRPSLSRTLRCIIAYFQYFDPHTPIIHQASFNISQNHPSLVLIMLAIGAVYVSEKDFAQSAYEASCMLLAQYEKQSIERHDSSFHLWHAQASLLCAQYGINSGDRVLFNRAQRHLFATEMVSATPASFLKTAYKMYNIESGEQMFVHALEEIRATRDSPNAADDWSVWIFLESCSRASCSMFVVAAMALAFNPFAMTFVPPMPEPITCPDDEIVWYAISEVEWRAARHDKEGSNPVDLWSLATGIFHGKKFANSCRISAFTLKAIIGAFLCSICTKQRLSQEVYSSYNAEYISKNEWALATWESLWRRHPRAEQSITRLDDPLLNECLSMLGTIYYHLYVGEELVVLKRIAENGSGLALPSCKNRSQVLKVLKYAGSSWLVRVKIGVRYLSKAGGVELGSQALTAAYETALILAWCLHLQSHGLCYFAAQDSDSEEDRVTATLVSQVFADISTELREQGACYERLGNEPLDPLGFYVFLYQGWVWECSSILEQRLRQFATYLAQHRP